jgi:hypothetical protein
LSLRKQIAFLCGNDSGNGDAGALGAIGSHEFDKFFNDHQTSPFALKKYVSKLLQMTQVSFHKEWPFAIPECDPLRQIWESWQKHLFLGRSVRAFAIQQPNESFNDKWSFNLINQCWLRIENTFRNLVNGNPWLGKHQCRFKGDFYLAFESSAKHQNMDFGFYAMTLDFATIA